jgi:hypothetical protein
MGTFFGISWASLAFCAFLAKNFSNGIGLAEVDTGALPEAKYTNTPRTTRAAPMITPKMKVFIAPLPFDVALSVPGNRHFRG